MKEWLKRFAFRPYFATIVVFILLLLATYWFFHPVYSANFTQWPNVNIALLLVGIMTASYFVLIRRPRHFALWHIYSFFIIIQFIVVILYTRSPVSTLEIGFVNCMKFIGYSIFIHLGVLIVYLSSFLLGDIVLKRVYQNRLSIQYNIISTGIGISLIGMVVFLFGAISLMNTWTLWAFMLLIFIVQRVRLLGMIKSINNRQFTVNPDDKRSLIYVLSMILFLSVTLIKAIKLFPLGYDGAGVYINIAHLVATQGELLQGFNAYNWSLFMSLGELLFKRESVTIGLSHFTIVPVLIGIYALSRRVLGHRNSLLVSLIFLTIPAVGYHMHMDEKIDLGFLFICIVSILLCLDYIRIISNSDDGDEFEDYKGNKWILLALLGWILGYATGVKYLGLFALPAILAMIYYSKYGWMSAMGVLGIVFSAVFFSGAYSLAYIEMESNSHLITGIISLVCGVGLILWSIQKYKIQWKDIVKPALVISVFALISFSPWMIKNATENRTLDIKSLLIGKSENIILQKISVNSNEKLFQDINSAVALRNITLDREQIQKLRDEIARNPAIDFNDLKKVLEKEILNSEQVLLTEKIDEDKMLDSFYIQLANRLIQTFKSQAIEFDNNGKQKISEILFQYPESVFMSTKRKAIIQEIREKVINEVLTPDQRLIVRGQSKYLSEKTDNKLAGSQIEEIKRYMGYETGLPLYLSLPFDITMMTNVPGERYLDIGMLFLFWIGFLLISAVFWRNIVAILLLVLFWSLSLWTNYYQSLIPELSIESYLNYYINSTQGWISSIFGLVFYYLNFSLLWLGFQLEGFYTYISSFNFHTVFIILIGLGGVFGYLVKPTLMNYQRNTIIMIVFAGFYGLLWFILGNGIIWYAFPAFMIMLIGIVAILESDYVINGFSGDQNRKIKYLISGLIGAHVIFGISTIFSLYTLNQNVDRSMIYNDIFILKGSEFGDKEETYEYFLPYMRRTLKKLNSEPDAKVYRIGTFFNYHILNNDTRVIEDNQLEQFAQLSKDMKTKSDYIDLLHSNGVKYILFDLNIGSIDRTPEQSLVAKANELITILFSSPRINLIYTDNIIEDPEGGEVKVGNISIKGKTGFSGKTVKQGSFVLFEII
jgi:hypothetical protein